MGDSSAILEGHFTKRATAEEPAEYQAFSFGRVGIKPQLTLLLRKANGEVEGFPYADFRGISATDEELGFTVRFDTRTVRVDGRNLGRLFQYICNYRAAEILELDERSALMMPSDKAVVWRVKW